MKHYCLGFAFTADRQLVALIRKRRPTWQAGYLNGPGGHVEAGETSEAAMRREFGEETGVDVAGWELFAELSGAGWWMDVYRVFDNAVYAVSGNVSSVDSDEGPVDLYRVDSREDHWYRPLPNLRWLIPLALDTVELATVSYSVLVAE